MQFRLIMISGLTLFGACNDAPREPARPANSAPPVVPNGAPPPDAKPIMSGGGVGCLRIGHTVLAVRSACAVQRDTVVSGAEGMPERQVTVMFGNEPVIASVVDDRVARLIIDGPGFRAGDSVGVGTAAARLLTLRDARVIEGEGRMFITSTDHCGMSFRVDVLRGARGGSAESLVRAAGADARVDRVLIFGC